jgi:hypothetical protein
MKRRQVIERVVHGGVAGRDVLNIDLFQNSEFEEQKLFYEKTRIDCTRLAREQLNHLAEVHDFRFTDLRQARRAGCLNWSEVERRWKATPQWLDYGAALFFAVIATGATLAQAVLLLGRWDSNTPTYLALLVATLVLGLAFIKRHFVTPHRIAKKAAALLLRGGRSRASDPCAGDRTGA